MSRHESDDRDGLDYLLPEDSQFRLARLRDHIRFLARLAQPRIANEDLEYAPEVRMGELTFCLEVLAEQLDVVLDEVSWPAQWTGPADAPAPDAAAAAGTDATGRDTGRFAYGVSVDQIDTLGRLIQTLSAHAGAVAASGAGGWADRTPGLLGQALQEGTIALRELLVQVQAQRLEQGPCPRSDARSGVGEQRGIYAVAVVSLAAAGQAGCARPRGRPSGASRKRNVFGYRALRTGIRWRGGSLGAIGGRMR